MAERQGIFVELFRMSAKMIVGGIIVIILFVAFIGALGASTASTDLNAPQVVAGDPASGNEIQVLRVSGPILSHRPAGSGPSLFAMPSAVTYGYDLKKTLEDSAENDRVKGVVLHVTTPGGTINGSQAIHEGVEAVKAAGKPIIAYVDGLSASGGVWATAGADRIFADHGSIVGSVGVRGPQLIEYIDPVALGGFLSSVETAGGIEVRTIVAGRGKDFGNPFRPPTEEELDTLQGIMDEAYAEFVGHVEANRGIASARLVEDFGAAVFGNQAAERNGYIDGTKTFQGAIAYVVDQLDLGEDYRVTRGTPARASGFALPVSLARWFADAPEARTRSALCADLREGGVIAISELHLARFCGQTP